MSNVLDAEKFLKEAQERNIPVNSRGTGDGFVTHEITIGKKRVKVIEHTILGISNYEFWDYDSPPDIKILSRYQLRIRRGNYK